MLTRIELRNYRALRRVDVPLSPLTVLVGPNASGKSSFLHALEPIYNLGLRLEDRWQHGDDEFQIRQYFDNGTQGLKRIGSTRELLQAHFAYQALHLDLDDLRSTRPAENARWLDPTGSNLANVFASLGRKSQEEASTIFCGLVPAFSNVETVAFQSGHLIFQFHDRWNDKVIYRPNEVSDGTMLVLAYVLLQFQSNPVDLITIEEPERGLHPYLMGELVSLWRKMTNGQLGGRQIQIVLATHSAELLDHLEAHEVRFFTRNQADGSVRVESAPPNDEHWREAFKTYQDSLGSMWLSGGLGGVPTR